MIEAGQKYKENNRYIKVEFVHKKWIYYLIYKSNKFEEVIGKGKCLKTAVKQIYNPISNKRVRRLK